MGLFEDQIKPQLKQGTPFRRIDPKLLVNSAKQIGGELPSEENLKNQLRKFYNAVKQIERQTLRLEANTDLQSDCPDCLAQLLFLRPHLANAQHKNNKTQPFCKPLDICLASDVIKRKADLTRFVKFFEAIVAYAG